MGRIMVIQGAQWGSEGKGMVAAALCIQRDIRYAVRTGAVNAGHTVYVDGSDVEYKMQQVPVGFVNRETVLVIGAGAFIHPQILNDEIKQIEETFDPLVRRRLFVDFRASLHRPEYTEQAKMENRHHAIGATGKGCSVAITDKIRYRGKGYKLFRQWLEEECDPMAYPYLQGIHLVDTVQMLHEAYDRGESIQLEGTQGTLLDLHLGPYPYTTHKQTLASQWVTEAGLAPGMEYETVLVARTYPIRVAGNSGPMPREISWAGLARRINKELEIRGMRPRVAESAIKWWEDAVADAARIGWGTRSDIHNFSQAEREEHKEMVSELHARAWLALPPDVRRELAKLFELTTVTKKLRRIAEPTREELRYAVQVNRPDYMVLTFANYRLPHLWGMSGSGMELEEFQADHGELTKLAEEFAIASGCPVQYVTTGPRTEHLIPVNAEPAETVNSARGGM